jgi:hypothetical protein
MKRMIARLASHLSPAGRPGVLGAVTCAASANVLGGLGQQLDHVVSGAISDCLGAQFLQTVPLLAAMNTGGLNTSSIATELAAALIGGALLAIFTDLVSRMR